MTEPPTPTGPGPATDGAPRSTKRPILRFVGGFAVGLVVLMGVSYLPFFEQRILAPYLDWSASVGSWLLDLFGMGTSADGPFISSNEFSIEIKRGCDAYEPTVLYLSALLAFPAPWPRKLTGALFGVGTLVVLNFVRIVSLFYIGVTWPDLFDMAHVDLWQAAFIVLSLLLWLAWAWRVTTPPAEPTGASG